jgi:hypothetical protein
MTEAEFAVKSTDCATFAAVPMPADTAARLIAMVGNLETMVDISELIGVMTV